MGVIAPVDAAAAASSRTAEEAAMLAIVAIEREDDAAAESALRELFGKLELRYTRTTCYATFHGETEALTYTVVARDSDSAAVVTNDPLMGQVISHIHFEGSYLWVTVGSGMFREFFKLIRPSGTRLRPATARTPPAGSGGSRRSRT